MNADSLTIQDNSTFHEPAELKSIVRTENSHVFVTAAISRNAAKGYGKQNFFIGDPREFERISNGKDG